jgi:hypothetical protein
VLLVSKLGHRVLLTTAGGLAAVIRAWYQRWGATDADLDGVLAGDAELAGPIHSATRAISITAPTKQVWPWIVQLGQGRGGFYSHAWLESLLPGMAVHAPAPYDFTWAFVLLPQSDGTTRLLVRERYSYQQRWAGLIVQPAQLVSSLMTPKMLCGIRNRAQRPAPGLVDRERIPQQTQAHPAGRLASA